MPKKKTNKPSDVEQAAPQQSIIEEAGLDPSKWQVVDAPAVNPNQPQGISPAPVNNSLTSGPLPPNFGYQPALVNTGYPDSTGPIGLMPIQGGPQVNSKAIGVTKTVIEQGTGGSGSGGVASPIVTLETNGAINSNQSVLNLIGGANIGVTSDAGGGVTFASNAHEVSVNGVAAPGPEVNFNNTIPAAPAGKTNILFQTDGATPITGISANMPLVVGDSGSGGTSGAVPAPPSGSAALNKFFKADATFVVPPTMVGDSGSGGTVGYVPAAPSGSAAAGKFLKADGTFAVPPGTGGAGNYQTVQNNGSNKPAEPNLNFLSPLVATDNPGNTSTDISVSVPFKIEDFNVTPVSVSNNNTEQTLMMFTLSANELGASQALVHVGRGQFSNTVGSTESYTFKFYLDSTVVVGGTSLGIVNGGQGQWDLDATTMVVTTGGGGTVEIQGKFNMSLVSSTSGALLSISETNTSTFAFDTTATHVFKITVQMGAMNSSLVCSQRQNLVSRVG